MTTNYQAMCSVLKGIDALQNPARSASPPGSPFDAKRLKGAVEQATNFPPEYEQPYREILVEKMVTVTKELRKFFDAEVTKGVPPQDARDEARLRIDTLVGAVTDWGNPDYYPKLIRFRAVIDDLYQSFRSKDEYVGIVPKETLSPLVTFAPNPDWGPSTMNVEEVQKWCPALKVGVVSLPISYGDAPLLWGVLGHECGGHDVVHAMPGLIEEIEAGLEGLAALSGGWNRVWRAWAEEATADVFGVLNIGPSFGVGLAAMLSVSETFFSADRPPPPEGTLNSCIEIAGRAAAEDHPLSLLRIHLVIGAVAALKDLQSDKKAAWMALLEDVAKDARGNATVITRTDDGRPSTISYDLDELAKQARAVGSYIVTAKFKALGDRSIQEIETWCDRDEATAERVRQRLGTDGQIGCCDAACLLAGAVMAFYDNSDRYDELTKALNQRLKQPFNSCKPGPAETADNAASKTPPHPPAASQKILACATA